MPYTAGGTGERSQVAPRGRHVPHGYRGPSHGAGVCPTLPHPHGRGVTQGGHALTWDQHEIPRTSCHIGSDTSRPRSLEGSLV